MKRPLLLMAAALAVSTTAMAQQGMPYMPGYPPIMVPPTLPGGVGPYPMPYGMPYGVPMNPYPFMLPVPYGQPAPMPPAGPARTEAPATPAAPVAAPLPAPLATPAPAPAPVAMPAPAAPAAPASPPPAPITPAANPYMQFAPINPFAMMLSTGSRPHRPYEMRRVIDQREKNQLMQMAVPMMTNFMRMGMPDAMNYFARKYKAKEGLSFDDVRDSLFLRANQLNMKKVGENLMWKDFQVVLEDKDAPRIEVYSFCDIKVGRDLLKISPEFVVFLPCRVAVMEDADKAIWVLMLDWNMDWISGFEKQLGLSGELIEGALDISKRLDEMMRAAANGDL